MQASYHSPLEGESQKPSRQAKADAVGGWTPTRQAKADSHSRDAAFAPLRLDCGLRPLADSPSRGE